VIESKISISIRGVSRIYFESQSPAIHTNDQPITGNYSFP